MGEQVSDDLLMIGDFAEVCGVPAKTLRYYDRIEIFNPAYVDPITNYRYYSRDQLPRINRILAVKDLSLSLKQIDRLLKDDLPLAELRGMLRIKRIEMQQHLEEETSRLARVESRLRQIEEARLTARRGGDSTVRTCPNCGRGVREPEGPFCPYCGKPLTPRHANLLPGGKQPTQLALKVLGVLLVALLLIIVVAGIGTLLEGERDTPELIARPLSESTPSNAQLALLSMRYRELEGQSSILFEGRIKNVSAVPFSDIVVVVSLYDADPGLITASQASVDRDVLSPGETTPFRVEVDTSPRASSYSIIFQHRRGSTLSVQDERSK